MEEPLKPTVPGAVVPSSKEQQQVNELIGILSQPGQLVHLRKRTPVQDKIDQLKLLNLLIGGDIDRRTEMINQVGQALPKAVLEDLRDRLRKVLSNAIDYHLLEYGSISSPGNMLRNHVIQEWNALVYYHYVPAENDPVSGPKSEEISLVAVFITGFNVLDYLPVHCVRDITEEILQIENK